MFMEPADKINEAKVESGIPEAGDLSAHDSRLTRKRIVFVLLAVVTILLISSGLILGKSLSKNLTAQPTPMPVITKAQTPTPESTISPTPASEKIFVPSLSPTVTKPKGAYVTIRLLDDKTKELIKGVDTKVHLDGPVSAGTYNGPEWTSGLLPAGEYDLTADSPGGYREAESKCIGTGGKCSAIFDKCGRRFDVADGDHQIIICTYEKF
ncbi:hypothetical protein E6Q11_00645 [Candidatus Dojkabacteria bacterium]|uniref:Uncharacterized protein n=1 Tax=Candidatus Dojkabacteria bacterium TaxID=2099670 RepID=A0A5C7JBQ9_9BACT|nr:MAG: hypothetical protein E6Q11_00645 [Candidatus Dojkabacteria bacterium]